MIGLKLGALVLARTAMVGVMARPLDDRALVFEPCFGVAVTAAEAEWERFVRASAGGDVVQTAAWGRSKQAMGFKAAVTLSRDRSGRIEGGALVVAKRIAVLGGRLPVTSVGYVARGPLVQGDDAERIERVLDAVEAAARQLGVRHLILQPPAGGSAIEAALAARGYGIGAPDLAPSCTLLIDLAAELETIHAGMSKSQRRNLEKARKGGAVVWRGDTHELATFQALHAATAERQGFCPLSLDYLERQWQALRPLGAVEIFFAAAPSAPDRPIAATWVTAFGATVTDKIPGWNGAEPALQPNIACICAAIAWAKAEGFRWFDLGGVDPAAGAALASGAREKECLGERKPAAFKARFGGQVTTLPRARQFTFNPVARPVVRYLCGRVATDPRLKRFVNGLRNG